MAQAPGTRYRLKVSAGTDYNPKTHQSVEVNGQITTLTGDWNTTKLAVRVKNYNGSPASSPRTSSYFDHPLHKDDLLSISFSTVFKRDINGNDLIFGNDFDHPIRDKLPTGFQVMQLMVKKYIDPTMMVDAYSDTPSIFSPLLANSSQFRISHESPTEDVQLNRDDVVLEGSDTKSGEEIRKKQGVPDTAKERQKHFRIESNREAFWFFGGIQYLFDFSNAYLNLTDLCLNLPGFPWPVHHLVDSETHELRYTLKNRVTGHVYMVVVFSLDLTADETENLEGELDAVHQAKERETDTEQWKRRIRGWC